MFYFIKCKLVVKRLLSWTGNDSILLMRKYASVVYQCISFKLCTYCIENSCSVFYCICVLEVWDMFVAFFPSEKLLYNCCENKYLIF